jgi:hypothetical protein
MLYLGLLATVILVGSYFLLLGSEQESHGQSQTNQEMILQDSSAEVSDSEVASSLETQNDVIEKNIEKRVASYGEQDKTLPEIAESRDEESVLVDVSTYNTFSEEEGYNQYPASVGYTLSNGTDKDVHIGGLDFYVDTHGGHIIKTDRTLYSITEELGGKDKAYYFKSYGGELNHILGNSIVIPAGGSKTVYLNIWNFLGDVFKEHQSSDKHTLITLSGVSSPDKNVSFNIGNSGSLTVKIPHTH